MADLHLEYHCCIRGRPTAYCKEYALISVSSSDGGHLLFLLPLIQAMWKLDVMEVVMAPVACLLPFGSEQIVGHHTAYHADIFCKVEK